MKIALSSLIEKPTCMKIPKSFLLIIAAILAFGAITPPRASAQVSVNFFYSNLHPYGEWVNCSYGYCWHPVNVAANWAPYTDGYWAYTDGGWTWVSYEDYGGIVYHYGRWVNIYGEGWVWVPGVQWAPAWVSWRSSPEYVGWAPLPPAAVFNVGFGFGGWVDARFGIGPGCYNFVGIGNFGAPALGSCIVNREQNVTIINNTTNITNITNNNTTTGTPGVYTGGPSYAAVAAHSSRPIPVLHLVRRGSPAAIQAANGKVLSHQQGNQLVVLAPKVSAPANGKFPAPPYVAKTLPADAKADNGWGIVKDPGERERLQSKIKSEAPSYAAAKPVNPDDLKLVSQKIAAHATPKALTTGQHPTPGPGATAAGKAGKTKTNEAALENAPATEAPTPTPGKLKTRKHAPEATGNETETGAASATPKHRKIRPVAIPADESQTPRHPNLQPFANGNQPLPKKHPTFGPGPLNPNNPVNGGQPGNPLKKRKPQPQGEGTPIP